MISFEVHLCVFGLCFHIFGCAFTSRNAHSVRLVGYHGRSRESHSQHTLRIHYWREWSPKEHCNGAPFQTAFASTTPGPAGWTICAQFFKAVEMLLNIWILPLVPMYRYWKGFSLLYDADIQNWVVIHARDHPGAQQFSAWQVYTTSIKYITFAGCLPTCATRFCVACLWVKLLTCILLIYLDCASFLSSCISSCICEVVMFLTELWLLEYQ